MVWGFTKPNRYYHSQTHTVQPKSLDSMDVCVIVKWLWQVVLARAALYASVPYSGSLVGFLWELMSRSARGSRTSAVCECGWLWHSGLNKTRKKSSHKDLWPLCWWSDEKVRLRRYLVGLLAKFKKAWFIYSIKSLLSKHFRIFSWPTTINHVIKSPSRVVKWPFLNITEIALNKLDPLKTLPTSHQPRSFFKDQISFGNTYPILDNWFFFYGQLVYSLKQLNQFCTHLIFFFRFHAKHDVSRWSEMFAFYNINCL